MNNSLNHWSSNYEQNEEIKFPIITLSQEIREIAPNLVIGAIFAEVDVIKKSDELWSKFSKLWNSIKVQVEDIVEMDDIKAIRQAYLRAWKEPSKYRWSAEALLRRISQWKWLYQINNIVDINNYLSVKSWIPCWSYNIENLSWEIVIRIWKPWEQYKWIWKEIINIENLPLFADDKWPFWSPTSDSERAMITLDSKNIMIMIISFNWDGNWKLDLTLNDWIEMLNKYASARNIQKRIIK